MIKCPDCNNELVRVKGTVKLCAQVEENKMVEAYCVKCKKKVQMKDAKETTFKNGRKADKGKCPKCGTTVMRIK